MFTRTLETSPDRATLRAELLELAKREPLARKTEREQFAAGVKAAELLVEHVSKRERVHVTIVGHDNEDGPGFNPRLAHVTVTRVDPAARQHEEERAAAIAAAAAEAERAEPVSGPDPDVDEALGSSR